MPKILLLTEVVRPDYEKYQVAARDLQIDLTIALFSDVLIHYTNQQMAVLVQQQDLQDFDLVVYRRIGAWSEMEKSISAFCKANGIVVIDRAFTDNAPWIDRKSFEYTQLSAARLPLIPSYFGSPDLLRTLNPSFPVVIKHTDLSQGEGVTLVHTAEEFESVLHSSTTPLLLQDYLENDGDIRVFILGDQVVGGMKRSSVSPTEFRNNVSLGGYSERIELAAEMSQIALQSAQVLGYQIAGVDLILDRQTNQWRILEVNRSPQLGGITQALQQDLHKLILQYLCDQLPQ